MIGLFIFKKFLCFFFVVIRRMPKTKKSQFINIESSDSSEEEKIQYKSLRQQPLSKKNMGLNSSSSSNEDEDENSNELNNDNSVDLNADFSDIEDDDDNEIENTKLSKKNQLKLKKELDEFYKVQTVEYSFNVNTTSRKEQLNITNSDLRINRASRGDDFDSISKLKSPKRASPNSDIVLRFEIVDLKTNYPGNIKMDFPTVKELNSYVGFQGEHFISYQKNNNKKNDKNIVLIDRELDDGLKSFLKSYPGNTTENFDSFCRTSPNNKTINVGLDPMSCIMYFFNNSTAIQDKDMKKIRQHNLKKKNNDVFEMPIKLYEHLKNEALVNLDKNFSFSDISSSKFNIIIYPLMSSTTQNAINTKIRRLEKQDKIAYTPVIDLLKKKGFSNFYNTNPQTSVNLDSQMDEFVAKPQKYEFSGTLRISYVQVEKSTKDRKK